MAKNGDIVEINYTGKLVEGNIFETTIEQKAKEENIFVKGAKYGPQVFIIGEGELLPGLEKALLEMNPNDVKNIQLDSEMAFGERKPELMVVLPLKEFTKRKINPFPGLVLDLNNQQARVQSVSGGRVRVDFNHPLAGKKVEFELCLEKVFTEPKDQLKALLGKFLQFIPEKELSFKISESEAEIKTSAKYEKALNAMNDLMLQVLTKHVFGLKTVKFVFEPENKDETAGNQT